MKIIGNIYLITTIVLIVLKMSNIINISWIWALCPMWIPILFAIIIVILYFIIIILSLNK